MANGNTPTPPPAAVDWKTQSRIDLNKQGNLGLARAASAGATPTVQQAYMQGATASSNQAAHNLRMRYWQKEWEQINDIKVQPILDQLTQAEAIYRNAVLPGTRPMAKTISAEEGQIIGEALTGAPTEFDPETGDELPSIAAQNPAMGQGQLGAVEMTDTISIMDPATGQPVDAAGNRGIRLQMDAGNDFWTVYQDAHMQLQDIFGEFAGNPFAEKAASSLFEELQNQAGIAATGRVSPIEQQQTMNAFQEHEATIEAKRAETGEREAQIQAIEDKRQIQNAGIAARVAEAREAVLGGDANAIGLLGAGIVKKLANGKPLTPKQDQTTAAIMAMIERQAKEGLAAKQRAGVMQIPAVIVRQPENWVPWMNQNDSEFTRLQDEFVAQGSATYLNDLMSMSPKQIESLPIQDPDVKTSLLTGNFADPKVSSWATLKLASDPGFLEGARMRALSKRLSYYRDVDPNVNDTINRSLDEYIRLAKMNLDPGEVLDQNAEDLIRMDPIKHFMKAVYGYDMHPGDLPLSDRVRLRQAIERRAQRTPFASVPAAQPQPIVSGGLGLPTGVTGAIDPDEWAEIDQERLELGLDPSRVEPGWGRVEPRLVAAADLSNPQNVEAIIAEAAPGQSNAEDVYAERRRERDLLTPNLRGSYFGDPPSELEQERSIDRGAPGAITPINEFTGLPTKHPYKGKTRATSLGIFEQAGLTSNVRLVPMTFDIDGNDITFAIPTMVNGKLLSEEQAEKLAVKKGLREYPAFNSVDDANVWIEIKGDAFNPDGTLRTGLDMMNTPVQELSEEQAHAIKLRLAAAIQAADTDLAGRGGKGAYSYEERDAYRQRMADILEIYPTGLETAVTTIGEAAGIVAEGVAGVFDPAKVLAEKQRTKRQLLTLPGQ